MVHLVVKFMQIRRTRSRVLRGCDDQAERACWSTFSVLGFGIFGRVLIWRGPRIFRFPTNMKHGCNVLTWYERVKKWDPFTSIYNGCLVGYSPPTEKTGKFIFLQSRSTWGFRKHTFWATQDSQEFSTGSCNRLYPFILKLYTLGCVYIILYTIVTSV